MKRFGRKSAIAYRLRGEKKSREGATAVEFALVAIPFFGLLFLIYEAALVLTVNAALESAVMNSGRLVRTGQISKNATAEDFKIEICGRMNIFESACLHRIQIDVQPVASFSNPGITDPIKDGVFNPGILKFDIGEARSFMLMRVWYDQPLTTPFFAHAMTRLENGNTVMHAATAFRNEPF